MLDATAREGNENGISQSLPGTEPSLNDAEMAALARAEQEFLEGADALETTDDVPEEAEQPESDTKPAPQVDTGPKEKQMCLVDGSQDEGCFDLVFPDGNRKPIKYEELLLEDPDIVAFVNGLASTHRICFRGFIECTSVQEAVKRRGKDKKYENMVRSERPVVSRKINWNNFFCPNCNTKANEAHPIVRLKENDVRVCTHCFMGYNEQGEMTGSMAHKQYSILGYLERKLAPQGPPPAAQNATVVPRVFGSADTMHREGATGPRVIPGRKGLSQS